MTAMPFGSIGDEEAFDFAREYIETLEGKLLEVEETVEYLTEKNTNMINTVHDLRGRIKTLEEDIEKLKNDSIVYCDDKHEFYSNLAHYYYHDDFSIQKFFDIIGRKSVEAEFCKFMNRE